MATKLGVLSPANNVVLEPEYYDIAPEGVAIYTTRMLTGGTHSLEGLRRMEKNALRGVEELAATGVDVIVYACLSTSLAKGEGWSKSFAEQVTRETGIPTTTALISTVEAMRELGMMKVRDRVPIPR